VRAYVCVPINIEGQREVLVPEQPRVIQHVDFQSIAEIDDVQARDVVPQNVQLTGNVEHQQTEKVIHSRVRHDGKEHGYRL